MMSSSFQPFREKMVADGQSEASIRAFESHFAFLQSQEASTIAESAIEPARDLPTFEEIRHSIPLDEALLDRRLGQTVVIKLNGGLGTSMGLAKAKSLVEVRGGATFLDLIVRQLLYQRQEHGVPIHFLLMSSFSTHEDTADLLQQYPELGSPESLQFMQSRVPKIDAATFAPAEYPEDRSHEWCPPGHGDLYPSLLGTGKLRDLLDDGVRYAFISNSDNLGATLCPSLLTYFADSDAAFMMEVTQRTAADRKGGHLAVRRDTGHLLLRESAQCAKEDLDAFQDIEKHRFFNTNNLWLRLDLLEETLEQNGGLLPLPVITNTKTVNPRETDSAKVYQLETAMGSAIGVFDKTIAVVVDRSRFAPVKTTADLLALRSDAYVMTADHRVVLHPSREGKPPAIKLDDAHYKHIDQLEKTLGEHLPSLRGCESLEVDGPVRFEAGVVLEGQVAFENPEEKIKTIPQGHYRDCRL